MIYWLIIILITNSEYRNISDKDVKDAQQRVLHSMDILIEKKKKLALIIYQQKQQQNNASGAAGYFSKVFSNVTNSFGGNSK